VNSCYQMNDETQENLSQTFKVLPGLRSVGLDFGL